MSTHDLVIGFDADDTLWHSEDGFDATHRAFVGVVQAHRTDLTSDQIIDVLDQTERANMALLGYGVKAYTISMVEAAIALGGGGMPANVIAEVVGLGRRLLERPTDLLADVAETVDALARRHRLVLITKGDLLHQERKVHDSGLASFFDRIEVVTEKDPATYRRVLGRNDIDPARFLMVGNSVKSDVLPVIEIGGRAVHIPYQYLWAHEHADHDGSIPELQSIAELPAFVATLVHDAVGSADG